MKLSAVKGDIRVERDGEFTSVGMMPRWRNGALVSVTNPIQVEKLAKGDFSGCVIVTRDLLSKIPAGLGAIVSEHPAEELYGIHNDLARGSTFYGSPSANEIDASAIVHPTAVIADRGVKIGKGCIVGPKAAILENSTLETGVVIGPGTVIGSEDALMNRKGSGSEKVLSTGGVIIGEKVEIHSNCNVSRAIFGGNTVVSTGTKFDNLIDIGQNAKIGERCFLAACASIGGNVDMGKEVWIGPNSTVSEGVTLGDNAYVTIGSVVVEDVGPNQKVSGNYAIDHTKFIEFIKKIR
jgi:UDP-3-O-[3-hydroxymyristoyl] glucosamine N-acyltransferase